MVPRIGLKLCKILNQRIKAASLSAPSSGEERRKRHKRLTAVCWEAPKAQGGERVKQPFYSNQIKKRD